MQHGQLISHVDTDLVTRAQLLSVPTPQATNTFKPIAHIELIDMLDRVLNQQSIHIRDEQFALRRDGAVLFGVLQLAYGETGDGIAALGLRTANNKSMLWPKRRSKTPSSSSTKRGRRNKTTPI